MPVFFTNLIQDKDLIFILYYRQRNILLGGISREEHQFCNEKGATKVLRVP